MIILAILGYMMFGMFWAGVSGSGSILDAVLTALIWPAIPAYLLGTRVNRWVSLKSDPRRLR